MALYNQLPVFPFDILSKIIETYTEDLQDLTQPTPSHQRSCEGPLLASRICRYWRAVAFSTPKIWSTLNIHPHLPHTLISHFLALAGESPLTLYVSLGCCGGIHSSTRVLDLLLSRISRWRSVHIWIDEGVAKEILRRYEETQGTEVFVSLCEASVLEELTIEGGFDVSPQVSTRLLLFFLHRKHFPYLRQLHWSLDLSFFGSPYSYSAYDSQTFAWEKLTNLSFTAPPSFAVCLSLLQECRNLQSLKIDYRSTPSTCLYPYPGCLTPNSSDLTIPESLRELTIKVDKPVVRGILTKFTKSFLDSNNLAIDVSA